MRNPDVVVLGGGPAGIAAATRAAELGAAVLIVDEAVMPGGQYFKRPPAHFAAGSPTAQVDAAEERVARMEIAGVEFRGSTAAWSLSSDLEVGLCSNDLGAYTVRPKAVVLASGAYERVPPFPGWTRPEVLTAGAAQNLVKAQDVPPGRSAIVAGSGPFLLAVATTLVRAGVDVRAVVESSSRVDVAKLAFDSFYVPAKAIEAARYLAILKRHRVPVMYGSRVIRAEAAPESRGLVVSVEKWRASHGTREISADSLCVGWGFIPSTELARAAGANIVHDGAQDVFAVGQGRWLETSIRGLFAAGEVAGTGGFEVAEIEGRVAGAAAAWRIGLLDEDTLTQLAQRDVRRLARGRRFAHRMLQGYPARLECYQELESDVVVCRCEDVTAGQIRGAVADGWDTVAAVKSQTRCGMGICQGRMCGESTRALIAAQTRRAPESVHPGTARAPVKPVPVGMLADLSRASESDRTTERSG